MIATSQEMIVETETKDLDIHLHAWKIFFQWL